MKLKKRIVISALVFFCSLPVLGNLYNWKRNVFDITTSAPPALIYVVDSQGRRTGGDPSQPVSPNGIQGGNAEAIMLQEIPLSEMDQSNEATDDGQSHDVTGWGIDIMDADKQTYTINLKGLTFGTERVELRIDYKHHSRPSIKSAFDTLVEPGITRKVEVTFSPDQGNISTVRVVAAGDLLSDVKAACQLKKIISDRTCDHLEKRAGAIQDALGDKHYEKAEGLVKSFLHILGEGKGDDDDDKDDHNAIAEPALTILKADAKALLTQIEVKER